MFKRIISIILLLTAIGCSPKKNVNSCERGLNVESLFNSLRNLPNTYTLREVTQDYVYSETNGEPSYLPRNIIVQDSAQKFLRNSWIGRQTFVQDCKSNTFYTDGIPWTIGGATPEELQLSTDKNANVKMVFQKLTENSFLITQTSRSDTLNVFEQKTLFRWGLELQNSEDIDSDFILGLYEEGLIIPHNIIDQLKKNPEVVPVHVDDLIDLQKQIKLRQKRKHSFFGRM